MSSQKPVILLVHGAWHRPSHYSLLINALINHGFEVIAPESVSSSNNTSVVRGKTYIDDVAIIHLAWAKALEAGNEIIVVSHSYGGIPAAAAVKGFQLQERKAKGLQGGVKAMVYIAAFALPVKGLSLKAAIGGTYPAFAERKDDILSLVVSHAKHAFYNDLDDVIADRALADCVYQSTSSFETPSDFVATDIDIPSVYITCENDQAIPIDKQLAMAGAMGDKARIVKLSAGHSAFAKLEALPEIIKAIQQVVS